MTSFPPEGFQLNAARPARLVEAFSSAKPVIEYAESVYPLRVHFIRNACRFMHTQSHQPIPWQHDEMYGMMQIRCESQLNAVVNSDYLSFSRLFIQSGHLHHRPGAHSALSKRSVNSRDGSVWKSQKISRFLNTQTRAHLVIWSDVKNSWGWLDILYEYAGVPNKVATGCRL